MRNLICIFIFFASIICFAEKPNFIIVFTDDQGYQDLSCFGAEKIKTPNIDRLASDGIKLTSFYVGNPVCSASRACLMTGKYFANVKSPKAVYFEYSEDGLSSEEITIAMHLKKLGYVCGAFGKWHLGHKVEYLPTNRGFDYYYGVPYSNDMCLFKGGKYASDFKPIGMTKEEVLKHEGARRGDEKLDVRGKVPLMRNEEIIEYPCDQSTLTKRCFSEAIAFIEKNKDKPFFAYIAMNMPHVPLYVSDQFKGKSAGGIYGDVCEEIDYNVGVLVEFLKKNKLYENTFMIYASDNGPWLIKENQGGHALPLRDGKGTSYEGGVRVPCVITYPIKFKKGRVSDEIISSIDLLPTIVGFAGGKVDQKIDGVDQSNFLLGKSKSARNTFYFYNRNKKLVAVREGDFKLILHDPKAPNRKRKVEAGFSPELYNLKKDISEKENIYSQNPEIVKNLSRFFK